MRSKFLALLLIAFSTAALAAESVRVIETRELPKALLPAASHELRLSIYTFKGTRWQTADIVAATLDALPLLAQCGIAVAAVELKVLEAPLKFRYYSVPVARELLREITVAKAALFFVDDTYSEPAYDAEAIGLSNAKTRPELANTIWFAYGAHDLPFAIAHELVHVLSDNGDHSEAVDNLMRAETSPSSTRLTDAQCIRMRGVAEPNGLLTRRAGAPRK